MMTLRQVKHCGKADYGWLQARYAFSFGHYFDPDFMGFKTLRVLNQEVIAPESAFQPKTYPHVDILNFVLQGSAEYRDSLGNKIEVSEGECIRFSPRPDLSYSEHNMCSHKPLTRLQLWLNACPQQEYYPTQKISLPTESNMLVASPDGVNGSIQLRQQIWVTQLNVTSDNPQHIQLKGKNAYLQSIHGGARLQGSSGNTIEMSCNDGVFIQDENTLTLSSAKSMRALLIDIGE
ncbi:pirin family protein [Providencia vermicola]|uniref:Pirin family protein n=1 Tax=Providencia vermicola TaxID=333965 RepID=A0AAX3S0U6_9GAMM|nr:MULTISPECIES: pirin family protein [Providencia]ELX8377719.1 pirin family protein [Providencia stuartii]EMD5257260.1 pirin family protein [Providencia stuartii]USB37239.1 pirin family protein [Providencia vermicola]WFC06171.1 pirin family protein [Providencia vermicola]